MDAQTLVVSETHLAARMAQVSKVPVSRLIHSTNDEGRLVEIKRIIKKKWGIVLIATIVCWNCR